MNTAFNFGRWKIEVDRAETALRYSQSPVGSGCSCKDCQNFTAVAQEGLPADLQAITDQLGIDVQKPAELAHYGRDKTGLHITGGWFHVIGRLLSGADAWKEDRPTMKSAAFEKLPSGAEFGFTPDAQLIREAFKGSSVLQMEFLVRVSWVLPLPEST